MAWTFAGSYELLTTAATDSPAGLVVNQVARPAIEITSVSLDPAGSSRWIALSDPMATSTNGPPSVWAQYHRS